MKYPKKLGILVGGGPAPGINSVISSATIEAVNSGLEVIGIYDGFEHLMAGRSNKVRILNIEDVSRIHNLGGSILCTSRANPTKHPEDLCRVLNTLIELDIGYLVTIGGDDTAFAASKIASASQGAIRVAHVPKTIDNDLPLPEGRSTFGFQTARDLGTQLVNNIMKDSGATRRWFFVVVMGRKAGHLALGIGKSAGATLTVIPEEFPGNTISLSNVCAILEGAIIKRKAQGKLYGVAVIAEGIAEKMDPEELASAGVELDYDSYGNLRLGEVPLGDILRRQVKNRLKELCQKVDVTAVTLGYELRCADPTPFDVDYTRTLGYAAVDFLLSKSKQTAGLIHSGSDGNMSVLAFEDLLDKDTGKISVRMVDMTSEHYRVSRKYMIRLEGADFWGSKVDKLAQEAGLTKYEFIKRFSSAVTYCRG